MLIRDPIQIELEFGIVGFCGEGKTRVLGEKPLGTEKRTNNKLNPHMAARMGIEPGIKPGQNWWEASALTYLPTSLPTYLATNQPTNISTKFLLTEATYQPPNLLTYQPTNLSTYQPTHQLTKNLSFIKRIDKVSFRSFMSTGTKLRSLKFSNSDIF